MEYMRTEEVLPLEIRDQWEVECNSILLPLVHDCVCLPDMAKTVHQL